MSRQFLRTVSMTDRFTVLSDLDMLSLLCQFCECLLLLSKIWFYRTTNFSQEPLLWAEMRAISEALQSDFRDEESIYLRGYIFVLANLLGSCYSYGGPYE